MYSRQGFHNRFEGHQIGQVFHWHFGIFSPFSWKKKKKKDKMCNFQLQYFFLRSVISIQS